MVSVSTELFCQLRIIHSTIFLSVLTRTKEHSSTCHFFFDLFNVICQLGCYESGCVKKPEFMKEFKVLSAWNKFHVVNELLFLLIQRAEKKGVAKVIFPWSRPLFHLKATIASCHAYAQVSQHAIRLLTCTN